MALMMSADYAILLAALLLPGLFGFSLMFGLLFGKEPSHF